MKQSTAFSWDKFLDPNSLRSNLIAASIFITSYEILKDSIIEQIKSFYTHGFDQNGPIVSESYRAKVLDLDSKGNHFRASIAWLRANGVIDAKDEQMIGELTRHRNDVAHNLPQFLSEAGREVELGRLTNLIAVVAKVDRWWIMNVELAIQDEINPDDVHADGIVSGRLFFLHMLLTTASGAESSQIYEEFLKQRDLFDKSTKGSQA